VQPDKRGVGHSNTRERPVLLVEGDTLLGRDAEAAIRRSPYRRERVSDGDGLHSGYRLIPADSEGFDEAHER
jgi:hypothetical protein